MYFRVSEDEFDQFTLVCKTAGARSISDLARSAMEQIVRQGKLNHEDEVAQRLRVLDNILTDLTGKIEQLNTLLGVSPADGKEAQRDGKG